MLHGSYGTRWAKLWLTIRNDSSLSLQKELARVKDETIGQLGILRNPMGGVCWDEESHGATWPPKKLHLTKKKTPSDVEGL